MNKNQKQIRALFRKDDELAIAVPAGGYHNEAKGRFTTRRMSKVGYKHKKKAKPFPTPNKETTLSLSDQKTLFYGI